MSGDCIIRVHDFKLWPGAHPSTRCYALVRSSTDHLLILVAKEPIDDGSVKKHVSVSDRRYLGDGHYELRPVSDSDLRLVADYFFGANFPYHETTEDGFKARHLWEGLPDDHGRPVAEADEVRPKVKKKPCRRDADKDDRDA